ncbi:hypothetical protein dqs_3686 [Azoarcus olearius]|uniref:PEP-CTERM sorting domain-containing protein n=1 Tax=Azoarcus sp. (strain BH72) TaxID=418699 RepID=UPI0008060C51|nr:PEP-CTERM sorting domain-containing protein [Azoarcus olearius]ANQ86703.1 hypothetical protein dqs_3686 [Azoarcus olearius]
MKNKLLAMASTVALLGALPYSAAHAGFTTCSTSDVKVTTVLLSTDTTSDITKPNLPSPINSFDCAGGFAGNDMPKPSQEADGNLGYAGDGLLNGAPQQGGQGGGVLFPGGAFISDTYPLSDLDKDGEVDDPGWIMLGRIDFAKDGSGTFKPMLIGGDDSIVWASFFTVKSNGDGTGTWAFTPDPDVAKRAFDILGKNYFDQFALIFKQSTAFAAYDFTAAQFGIEHPTADMTPLHFGGTFDISKTLGKGLSHVSLWARDPSFGITTVPEPGALGLLGLATLGLAFARRKRA